MILARILPESGEKYRYWSKQSVKLDHCMTHQNPLHFFGLWSILLAGMSLGAQDMDRYAYWDGAHWLSGSLLFVVITFLYVYVLHPKGLFSLSQPIESVKDALSFVIGTFLLLAIGFFIQTYSFVGLRNILPFLPYIFSILGGIFVFNIPVHLNEDIKRWDVADWSQSSNQLIYSFVGMLLGMLLGFYLDDPMISTVSMIAMPFPVIALLYPNHIRHIQRARFFPIFIFLMFLCVRIPWAIIPIYGLFYLLRSYHYLRFGIIYPTFGVDHEEYV